MKTFFYLILTVFLIYNLNVQIHSQDKPLWFEHITVDNGLSENAVTSIIQDKQGFLWFGTFDGLNRFDGYNFKVYRNNPKNPFSISSNIILSVFEDSDEVLWIGTNDMGLNKFNRKTNRFIHYKFDSENPDSISGNVIRTIYEDKNKILWIGSWDFGLNRFDRKTQKFQRFINNPKDNNSICNNSILTLFEDSKGVFWIGTAEGLDTFDREKEVFSHIKYSNSKTDIASAAITNFAEDINGFLWISTTKGLIKYNRTNLSFIHFQNDPSNPITLRSDFINCMFIDRNDLIWLGLSGIGIDIYNPGSGLFNHLSHDPNKKQSLSHNLIRSIFMDKSDMIWIATEGGGLNKFDKRKILFKNFFHEPSNRNSLSQNNIKRIYEDSSGILWIGTDGKGLNRFDRKENKFELFINDPKNPNSISGNYIKSICEDRFGFLWIGTLMGGLNKYDKHTKKFSHYKHDPKNKNSLPGKSITDILEDHNGDIWIANEHGLAGLSRYDREKNIFINYYHNPDDPKSISNLHLIDIFEDNTNTIWCGGGNGLNRFNRKDGSFKNYFFDPKNNSSLSHNWAWSIFEDKKNRLWIGTYGGGLNLFDRKTDSFINYTEKDGLANNVVYGILDDKDGNLWVSTNKGISKFDPEKKYFKNFDIRDGLQGNEFNTGSYYKGKDGRLYFGGTNGLTAFYPEQIKTNPNIPSIVITSFKVFNKEFIHSDQISKTKKISLKYDQNFISFEFAALDFSIPSKNQYAYKMEGVEKEWTYRNADKRFVNYTELSPGNYIFKVKGSNNDGLWNSKGASIEIHILPPFWKTWWFTVIWAVLIIFVFLFITNFIYRYITLLKEKAQAEKFAAIGKYASFLAHDIKSPLEGTYLIVNELKKMLPENDEKQEYIDDAIGGITQIRSIIKGSLDFSKVNNPKMEQFDLNKIIIEFCSEFKKIKNCKIDLKLNKEVSLLHVDHSLFKRVFFNLFQNSFQARKKNCEITIKTELKKRNILIYISDKGKGISKKSISSIFEPFSSTKEEGFGIGLAYVSEVIKNHDGTIRVESKFGKGTTFIISLPIIRIEENK